jgi:hypothetical protein
LVETVISWRRDASTRPGPGNETFSTIGVDSDQLGAAVIATEKMLNAVVPRPRSRSRAAKTSKPANPSKPGKSDKSGKSNKPDRPDKSARSLKGGESKAR